MRFSLRTLFLAVFVVAILFGVWRLLPAPPPWHRVRVGMTPAEVEAVMGKRQRTTINKTTGEVIWGYGSGLWDGVIFQNGKVVGVDRD